MDQRVSLITLGVPDPDRAAAFYQALGWRREDGPDGVIAFDLIAFDLIGQTLGLYSLDKLAEDMGLPVAELGHGAMTLSHNLRDRAQVDALMRAARDAGAEILRPAADTVWGGYCGYFRDPAGHVWEVAFNPFAPLGPEGAFRWNGYPEG